MPMEAAISSLKAWQGSAISPSPRPYGSGLAGNSSVLGFVTCWREAKTSVLSEQMVNRKFLAADMAVGFQ